MSKLVKFEALVVSNGIRQTYFVDAKTSEEARKKVEDLIKGNDAKIVYLVSTSLLGTEAKPSKVTDVKASFEASEVLEAPVVNIKEEPTEAVESPVVEPEAVAEAVEVEEPKEAEEPKEVEEPKAKPKGKSTPKKSK